MDKLYAIIDIETTGGQARGNKITEIAILNIDGDKIVDKFSTLLNPEKFIPHQWGAYHRRARSNRE